MANEIVRNGLTFLLDLNKHPKNAVNLSLINAENFKISEDGSSLISDKSLLENLTIKNKLAELGYEYKIIHCIPTSDEIVLFVISNEIEYTSYDLELFRYNEKLDTCSGSLIPTKMKYYGGKFSGTYTYNSKNELIITFCEYDSTLPTEFECGEPMKTINLGYWDKDDDLNNIIINDNNLDPRTFPICPEVVIPEITNWSIQKGLSKKGWYHFYIRYKINKNDYTQWFDFGRPFYLDESKDQIVFDYKAIKNKDYTETDHKGSTALVTEKWKVNVHCSDEYEVCSKTIKFDLKNLSDIYQHYQLGFTCSTKTYTDCKITNDIDINNNSFELIYKNTEDYDVEELIRVYENYYNVKNIINYNNRLYISNYKTKENIKEIPNNINFSINTTSSKNTDEVLVNINGEIRNIKLTNNKIKASELFNVKKLYSYRNKTKHQYSLKGIAAGADSIRYEELFLGIWHNNTETHNYTNLSTNSFYNTTSIELVRGNGIYHNIIDRNSTLLNGESYSIIKKYWCKRIKINFDIYNDILDISDYEFIYEEENKRLYCYNLESVEKIIGINNELYHNGTIAWVQNNYFISDFVEFPDIQKAYYEVSRISEFYDLNDKFTLIPKQVYSFFVHYVDKYGKATEGLPIRNIKYEDLEFCNYIEYNNELYCSLGRAINRGASGKYNTLYKVFLLVKYGSTIEISAGNNFGEFNIDFSNILFKVEFVKDKSINEFVDYEGLSKYAISYEDSEIITLKEYFDENWHEEATVSIAELVYSENFEKYKKYAFNDLLLLNKFINGNGYQYGYLDINSLYFIVNNDVGIETININFNNIIIPTNYVSYFISYEKLNKTLIWNGFSKQVNVSDDTTNTKTLFFTDALDYRDTVELSVNIDNHGNIIDNVKYNVADAFIDDNRGLSSNLKIYYKDEENHLAEYLYKYPLNLYPNKNKTLLRITEVKQDSYTNTTTYSFYSYNTPVIVKDPYKINARSVLVKPEDPKKLFDAIPFYNNLLNVEQYSYIPDSSKQINNPPKVYKVITNDVKYDEPTAEFYDAYIILPQDTVDLFKNNALDFDSSVLSLYTNYNKDNINQNNFIKTIRRSTYIKDESLENGWRIFESDAYQNITENKGEIVRIEGIGNLLLVHTKHSLFQFDKSNLLATVDKDIQLSQGDTFDVGYREIFTSPNGYGGLQDKDAAIVGEFGYIYYNNDFRKFYRYDGGTLSVISANIEFLLNKYVPEKCKFVDDKFNKRLIIQLLLTNDSVLNLTYNYKTNTFISFYINEDSKENTINETYNTKTKFYILEDNKVFNDFDKGNAKKLSFIINENYNKIKRLNYIKYKLYKRIDYRNEEFDANLPVEGNALSSADIVTNYRKPYSGYQIRVYNDLCDTGYLNIESDDKITFNDGTKPYYDLGNFTFSYLRDNITKNTLVGNFFIVEFTFNQNDNDTIEFESLEYNIDYEKD